MKRLYVVEHFKTAFPTSEYGGLWNVIDGTDEEVYDLIVEDDNELNTQDYGINFVRIS